MKTTSSLQRRLQLAVALVVSTTAASTSSAVDYFFNVANGDWNTPGSWTPAGPPAGGGGNFAYVNNGGVASILLNVPSVQDYFVGSGAGTVGTVNHSAGVASNTGWSFIGEKGGSGEYNLTGPGNTLGSGSFSSGRLYVGGRRGVVAGGIGDMDVNTTGSVTATSDLSVGTKGGTGTMTITAGTVTANSWMIIGETADATGGATGTVVQQGGNVNVSTADTNGRLWIGTREGAGGTASNGSYTINNGTLTARTTIIGKDFTGNFEQNGGIVTLNQGTDGSAPDHRLGEAVGAIGNYNMGGGILNLNANFQIGYSGAGHFNLYDGTVNANLGFPVIGRNAGGVGTLDVSGGSFNQLNGATQLIVGEQGMGTLTVSATGAVNVTNTMTLGALPTGNGTVTQTGGTVAIVNNLDIQGGGTGLYTLDGGTLSVNGTFDGTNGTFTFTGGVLTRSNAGTINYLGNLTVGQNDATLKLDNNKLFAVSGAFNITTGVTFDVTGTALPAAGVVVQTGSIPLGTDGSILGTFDLNTFVTGLINPAGASYITEVNGEATNYNPLTQSVYWVQENAGNVTLNYSIVPEPSAFISLVGGLGMLVAFQRRRRA